MSSTGPEGEQLGNRSAHLGRWYMAHVEGSISNVRFSTPPRQTVYGYERDTDGVYVRRRFSFPEEYQRKHRLPNVVSWLGNPEIPDAGHGSGPLSFVYLALTSALGPRFAPEVQRLSLTGAEIPGTPYGGGDHHVSWLASKQYRSPTVLHRPLYDRLRRPALSDPRTSRARLLRL
jgi:hypothetical protein